jgi:hypothetical protein
MRKSNTPTVLEGPNLFCLESTKVFLKAKLDREFCFVYYLSRLFSWESRDQEVYYFKHFSARNLVLHYVRLKLYSEQETNKLIY